MPLSPISFYIIIYPDFYGNCKKSQGKRRREKERDEERDLIGKTGG